MKFKINEYQQVILRKLLVKIASEYLVEEEKGLFVTTTDYEERINNNISSIMNSLLGEDTK